MTYEDIQSERALERVIIAGTSLSMDMMIYGQPLGTKPPLFILNSHEFSMPPSEAFCETAWAAGYQTIFMCRSGCDLALALPKQILGAETVRNGAATVTEAAMLARFIDDYSMPGAVVLSLGGSNPVAYRLCHFCQDVDLFVMVNPVFNQAVWDSFSPAWFRSILKQTLSSRSALRMSSVGIKQFMGRDPVAFYHQILSQSAGDIAYLHANRDDFAAAAKRAQSACSDQFFYELYSNILDDTLLTDGAFNGTHVMAMTGLEAPELWRTGMQQECARLNVPMTLLPSGFIFSPYQSSDAFFEAVKKRLTGAADRNAVQVGAS